MRRLVSPAGRRAVRACNRAQDARPRRVAQLGLARRTARERRVTEQREQRSVSMHASHESPATDVSMPGHPHAAVFEFEDDFDQPRSEGDVSTPQQELQFDQQFESDEDRPQSDEEPEQMPNSSGQEYDYYGPYGRCRCSHGEAGSSEDDEASRRRNQPR